MTTYENKAAILERLDKVDTGATYILDPKDKCVHCNGDFSHAEFTEITNAWRCGWNVKSISEIREYLNEDRVGTGTSLINTPTLNITNTVYGYMPPITGTKPNKKTAAPSSLLRGLIAGMNLEGAKQ